MPENLSTVTDRRGFLCRGAYGSLAAALAGGTLPSAAIAATPKKPIRSCIFVVHYGGPSHIDTWDMKPEGPTEIRGEYRPIVTSSTGRLVCEHLPKMAKLADKVALIRSMNHPMTNHNAAMYEALVGRRPRGGDNEILPANRTRDFPAYGSALSYLMDRGSISRPSLPLSHVALPHVLHNVVDLAGQNAGFLGGRHDPLQITSDPNHPDFRVDSLHLPQDVPHGRLGARQTLLSRLERLDTENDGHRIEAYRSRAFELLFDKDVERAFRIQTEPADVRDRYGRHKFGQSMLLARRLVEAGVPFVNVNDKRVNGQLANWDSHSSLFPRHRELLASMDQGLSALLEDLSQRGLLDSTLVVSMGEFGRTPKVNRNAGRDHWPHCFHVLLSGGGVIPGSDYGASDRTGAYPDERPVTPGDLAATLFWRFGVDPKYEIHDVLGRPFQLATGNPLKSLFA